MLQVDRDRTIEIARAYGACSTRSEVHALARELGVSLAVLWNLVALGRRALAETASQADESA